MKEKRPPYSVLLLYWMCIAIGTWCSLKAYEMTEPWPGLRILFLVLSVLGVIVTISGGLLIVFVWFARLESDED